MGFDPMAAAGMVLNPMSGLKAGVSGDTGGSQAQMLQASGQAPITGGPAMGGGGPAGIGGGLTGGAAAAGNAATPDEYGSSDGGGLSATQPLGDPDSTTTLGDSGPDYKKMGGGAMGTLGKEMMSHMGKGLMDYNTIFGHSVGSGTVPMPQAPAPKTASGITVNQAPSPAAIPTVQAQPMTPPPMVGVSDRRAKMNIRPAATPLRAFLDSMWRSQ